MTEIKPVRSEDDLNAALAEIASLIDASDDGAAADRLEVLTVLAADYERRAHPVAAPDPIDVLEMWMRMHGRTQTELADVLGSRSRASEVLARRRARA